MTTIAGSLALRGSIAPKDAFLVERLRAAGAVLLGKTNLSEWANFRGARSTSGWSGRGGLTRNPYALDRNPSGSSSGSAVAVAAGFCAAAIGTETNGSIVSPCPVCGELAKLGDAGYQVMLFEFKAGLNAYLAALENNITVRTLADVIAFNDRHKETELRCFGQEIMIRAQEKGPLTDPAYLEALEK